MTALEARCRQLLRIYPRDHRALYEEEMVTVLMSGAGPGRRRPSPADVIDVVRAGLTVRLGRGLLSQRGTGWRDAAAVAALFAALLLAGVGVGRLSIGLAGLAHGDPMRFLGVDGLLLLEPVLRSSIWLLTAGAALLGRSRAPIVLAMIGVLVQAGAVGLWAGPEPWQALRISWAAALALVTLALFAVARTGRPALVVLGRRGRVHAAAGVGLAIVAEALTWNDAWFQMLWSSGLPAMVWSPLPHLPPALFLLFAARAAGPGVSGRIGVLAAVVVAVPVAFHELERLVPWSAFFDLTPGIAGPAIAVLILTPVVVFAVGVVVLAAVESFTARRAGHLKAHE